MALMVITLLLPFLLSLFSGRSQERKLHFEFLFTIITFLKTFYRPFQALCAFTISFHLPYNSCTEFTLTHFHFRFFTLEKKNLSSQIRYFKWGEEILFGALDFLSLGSLNTESTSTLKLNGTGSWIKWWRWIETFLSTHWIWTTFLWISLFSKCRGQISFC
jgi:hypothetical protein